VSALAAAPHPAARRAWLSLIVVVAIGAALYVGLPQVAGLDETWGRLSEGDPWWLIAALLFEIASYTGYVVLFRGVFADAEPPIGWRDSYDITMAGVAATRLFATAGLGGIALTGWALARSGMGRGAVVRGLSTFLAALYGVYMLALMLVGAGLRSGLLTGPAPFALTVVPAAFGAAAIAVALATSLLPRDLDRRVRARPARHERLAGMVASAASAAGAIAAGIRGALALLRGRDPALLGAVAWWGFDIGVLWACFHAFGEPPPPAVLVMTYFTGMLGNLLPLPGGVGGTEGGMLGAFAASGVDAGLALLAVVTYQVISTYLPALPGLIAYLDLRRRMKSWGPEPAEEPLAAT